MSCALSYDDLAWDLDINKAQAWRLVERAKHLIRRAAVAEALVAGLGDRPVCAVDPASALLVPELPTTRLAAVLVATETTLRDLSAEAVRGYLQAQDARLRRRRSQSLYLIGEEFAGGVRLGLGRLLDPRTEAGQKAVGKKGVRVVLLPAIPHSTQPARRAA